MVVKHVQDGVVSRRHPPTLMNMSGEAVDVTGVDGDVVGPRTRGRPARISRERIIAAARTIEPEALTMQRVADVLGVDPKALNYHVRDRDGLRQLVVLDVFESELRRVKIPGGGDWREVIRAYVHALREATIKLGVLAVAIHLPGTEGLGSARSGGKRPASAGRCRTRRRRGRARADV